MLNTGEQPSDSEVQQLLDEVEKCTLASHLLWGVWGIISVSSLCPFLALVILVLSFLIYLMNLLDEGVCAPYFHKQKPMLKRPFFHSPMFFHISKELYQSFVYDCCVPCAPANKSFGSIIF